ncbi:MAG TPA: hypothetical protein DCG49_05000 [Ruminococcus sp.]|nr:hypothetical protein [Ruminococcus sp.]
MNSEQTSFQSEYVKNGFQIVPDVLDYMSQHYPQKGCRYLHANGSEVFVSYPEIRSRSLRILDALRKKGVHQGDRIAVETDEPEIFHSMFWACMYGGIIISSIQQPQSWDPKSKSAEIFVKQLAKLDRPMLITQQRHAEYYQDLLRANPELNLVLFEDLHSETEAEPAAQDPGDIIYIQFSSGTTGVPEGAMLSHWNILYCSGATAQVADLPEHDTVVSWLPHTHNLGLFTPLIIAMMQYHDCFFTTPAVFLHDPFAFLKRVSSFTGIWFSTNNFAMEWIIQKVPDEKLEELDMSNIDTIFAGSEIISGKTVERFLAKFGKRGLRREVIRPGYGMTEATLVISVTKRYDGPISDTISRKAMMHEQKALPADAQDPNDALCLLSNGEPLGDLEVRITDENRNPLPERMLGEIEARGQGLFQGYYNEPDSTAKRVRDGWLCTGDIGYLLNNRIFIVGRKKDIAIIRGANYVVTDIEECISAETGIPRTVLAVVGISQDNEEQLAVFVVNQDPLADFAQLAYKIRAAVLTHYQLEINVILPIAALPKTGSGKVKRYEMRMQFENGLFDDTYQEITALLKTIQPDHKSKSTRKSRVYYEEKVAECWSQVLKIPAEQIEPETPFYELGGNSIQAYRLILVLSEAFGMELGQEVISKYNTVSAMADYLKRQKQPESSARTEQNKQEEKIVITGIGVRLPGAATQEAFWENLVSGKDCVSKVEGKRRTLSGSPDWDDTLGLLSDIDSFDYDFFDMSYEEAKFMDPQQRMSMEATYEALEDAGMLQDETEHENVAVFACNTFNSYTPLVFAYTKNHGYHEIPQRTLVNNMNNMIAARISHQYGFVGPVMAVDTACSSFLTGLHLARNTILHGEAEGAVVCGSNLIATKYMYELAKQAGIVTPSGKSKVFDEDADGSVLGEGIVVFYLQKMSDALRNHSQIYGVIHGTAINNDGYALSVTSPNPRGEYDVLHKAYAESDVSIDDISYIEAHGTGTVIGDPIEIAALSRQFSGRKNPEKIAVGSVKTNIGHLLPAAAGAGILKTLLCMKHRQFVKSLHMEHVNPLLEIEKTPFRLLRENEAWNVPDGKKRFAGVTSLGLGGTNAHVILGEYIPEQTPVQHAGSGKQILTVSAKTPDAMEKVLQDTTALLHDPAVDTSVLCMTRNRFRRHYAYRAALLLDENGQQTGDVIRGRMHRQIASDVRIEIGDTGFENTVDTFKTICRKLQRYQELLGRLSPVTGLGVSHWIAEYVNDKCSEQDAVKRFTAGTLPQQQTADQSSADLVLQIGACAAHDAKVCVVNGSFAPDSDDDILENLMQLYVHGAAVNWQVLDPAEGQSVMHLPPYPFEKNHVWLDSEDIDSDNQ